MSVLLLFVSLGVILLAAQIFTNGIEWIGVKLNLTEGAVGSILAAVGTAMPESLIPLVAFVTGGGSSIRSESEPSLGAPFMPIHRFYQRHGGVLEARRRFDFSHFQVDERSLEGLFSFDGYSLPISRSYRK